MKRYWFSILLPVLIAVSIGTFYVGAATRDLPDYRLQTVAGDVKEASNLVFEGQTDLSEDVRNETIEVGIDGTKYDRNKSILAQAKEDEYRQNPDLAQLMKDHSGFMRGKNNDSGYYADKDKLVYAVSENVNKDPVTQLSNYRIAISTQDLKTGKKKHFNAIVPGQQKYSFLYVYDVQAAGDKIQLLVNLSKNSDQSGGGSVMSEIHLLTVDTDKEGISDDQTIAVDGEIAPGKAKHSWVYDVGPSKASPSDYVLITQSTVLVNKDKNGNWVENAVSTEYSVLDYRTAKLTPIPGGGNFANSNGELLVNDGKLVTMTVDSDQVHVQIDDLAKGAADGQFDIPLALHGADSPMNKFIYGGRLYIFHRVNTENEVLIADLSKKQVVYQGKISVDGTAEQQKERMKSLNMYSFYLAR